MTKITLLLAFLACSSVVWGAPAIQPLPDAPAPQAPQNAKFWTPEQ